MRADQERVRELLTDTVTLLCKNGLHFGVRLRIEGVLGITIDDSDVFIVHINESISTGTKEAGEDVNDSSSRSLSSMGMNVMQAYRPSFRSRKRLNNVQSNQIVVNSSTTSFTNDLLEAKSQAENDYGNVSVPSMPVASRLEPVIKFENPDTDCVNIIELDNNDETEGSGEAYSSTVNVSQLSNSCSVLEKGTNDTEVVHSKLKKINDSNRRFKIPIRNLSSTDNGSKINSNTAMNINSNRSPFNSNTLVGVNVSSVDITEASTKQEESLDLSGGDGYWNANMESNSEADFGVSGNRRAIPYSYYDSSQSGRNGSRLFPVAAWQVAASRRSSATGVQKPYICPHAGCGLRFYHRNNVSRHCTLKHCGAGVRQRGVYSSRMDSSYESSFNDPSSAIYSDSNIMYNDNSSS